MDVSAKKLLESVEQFVSDENKIVTYEFLSQTCGIHVNLAKNILQKYADEAKDKLVSVEVVYSLGGYVGKNLKFFLVTGPNLNEAESKLDKVLFVHVYSVQKGKLDSFGLLYNSNKTELKNTIQQATGYAGIKCSLAKPRTIEKLDSGNHAGGTNNLESSLKEIPKLKSEPTKEAANENSPPQPATSEPGSKIASSVKGALHKKAAVAGGNKPPAIAAFFAKHQTKGPADNKKKEDTVKKVEEKKSASNKRIVREPSDNEENEENCNEEKGLSSTKRLKLCDEDVKPKTQIKAVDKGKSTTKKSKEKKKSASSSNKPQRKRIQQFSDSESSDAAEEDEDIMLSSPEMAIRPAPEFEDDEDYLNATVIEPDSQKRTRKLVSKHTIDKEGFVVTTKQYETCEVEEKVVGEQISCEKTAEKPEAVAIKTDNHPTTKRPSPPGKSKQKSIMSFFARK